MIAAFIVIEDGKIVKRSFKECPGYISGHHAENEALAEGVGWIVGNMDDLRDMNLQVFLCGSARNDIKKMVDNGTYFERDELRCNTRDPFGFKGNDDFLKMFNKITYHTASRVVINDGKDDDPDDAEPFDVYKVANIYFTLLYGEDVNPGHAIHEDVNESGTVRKLLVGKPEIRWWGGFPKTEWT